MGDDNPVKIDFYFSDKAFLPRIEQAFGDNISKGRVSLYSDGISNSRGFHATTNIHSDFTGDTGTPGV